MLFSVHILLWLNEVSYYLQLPFIPKYQEDVKWCILNANLKFPRHVDSVTVNFLETVSSFIMLVVVA